MRDTLGQLRNETPDESAELREAGLDRLPALCEAVTAAGAPVTVTTKGEPRPVPPAVGHAAYRILQESLTNVRRHGGLVFHIHSQPWPLPRCFHHRSHHTHTFIMPFFSISCRWW